jgi:hypothetical protein
VRQEWTDRGVPASSDRLAVDGLVAARALGGRWCIPWDHATQEIYRQKVAGSFRLKPVPPTTQRGQAAPRLTAAAEKSLTSTITPPRRPPGSANDGRTPLITSAAVERSDRAQGSASQ